MMRPPVRSAALACLLAAALAAVPAQARERWSDGPGRGAHAARGGLEQRMIDRPRYDEPQAEGMSLDRAVDMVQRRFNARVVRAEEKRDGDRTVYSIRLLSNDGRVFTVYVDPRTGEIR